MSHCSPGPTFLSPHATHSPSVHLAPLPEQSDELKHSTSWQVPRSHKPAPQAVPRVFGVRRQLPLWHVPSLQSSPIDEQCASLVQATQSPEPLQYLEPSQRAEAALGVSRQVSPLQAAVQHSFFGAHVSSLSAWPSALHVTRLLPLHVSTLGIHLLHLPLLTSQRPTPQALRSAKSEPSALQLSRLPEASQVVDPGMQTMSVHAPAESLHNASEAHFSLSSQCPLLEHSLSCTPSQEKAPGAHCAHAPLALPI